MMPTAVTIQIKLENKESPTLIGLYDKVLKSSVHAPNKFRSITTQEFNSLEEVFLFTETVQFKHKWQSVYRDHFEKAAAEIRLQTIKEIVATTCKRREMDATTKVEGVKREIVRMMMTLEGRAHAATQAALKKRKDEDFRTNQQAGEEAAKRVHQAREDRIAKRKALQHAKVEALAQAMVDAEVKLKSETEEKARQDAEKEEDEGQVPAEQKEILKAEGSPAGLEQTESGADLATDGNNADTAQHNVNEDSGHDTPHQQTKNIYRHSLWMSPLAAYSPLPFPPPYAHQYMSQFLYTPSYTHPSNIGILQSHSPTHYASEQNGNKYSTVVSRTQYPGASTNVTNGKAITTREKETQHTGGGGNKLNVDPSQWNCHEVGKWIASIQLSEDYSNIIVNNNITGPVLLSMDTTDWKALGISKFGDLRILELQRQVLRGTPSAPVNDLPSPPNQLASCSQPIPTNQVSSSPPLNQQTLSLGHQLQNNIKRRSFVQVLRWLGVSGLLVVLLVRAWFVRRRLAKLISG